MLLSGQVIVTPRLLPGFHLGGAFVSIEYNGDTTDGRTRYRYFIDLGGKSHSGADLNSGCGGGNLNSGLASLVSFLGACGESVAYADRSGGKPDENTDLFPAWAGEWAAANSDELSMIGLELEETAGLIREE